LRLEKCRGSRPLRDVNEDAKFIHNSSLRDCVV
jgi:hypothetical protein